MAEFARPGADEWVPDSGGLAALKAAAPACRGCELYKDATQVVFGDGAARARLMLVGEQPGDLEDRTGEPFVGPSGRLLGEVLDAVGLSRDEVYTTNAVKHFRFVQRGKRRLHASPTVAHLTACSPWLEAELRTVRPEVVVALGASAARAVLGRPARIGAERGRMLDDAPAAAGSARVLVTVHPSAVLRLRGTDAFDAEFDRFVADLRVATDLL